MRFHMHISEDRISHLSHKIVEKLWRDDLADFPDEARALGAIKSRCLFCRKEQLLSLLSIRE